MNAVSSSNGGINHLTSVRLRVLVFYLSIEFKIYF